MTHIAMLVVIAAAAFACGREHDEGAGAAPAGSEATVPGVETVAAAVEPVRDTVDGFGAVTSAGEPAEVRDARAELAAAEARRQLAAQQARRLEALATGAVAPRKEIDAARAEEAAAAAAAARARQVLGAFGAVAGGSPLADDEVWVLARILQRDVPLVQAGAGASVRADAVPEPALTGHVDAPPAYVDPLTQLAPVRLRVRDPARALRPGMTGAVRIEVGEPRAAVVVPAAAVVRDGAQPFVFVEAAAGRFEAQPVRIGVTRDGRVEITDGVAAGARVATTGAASLLSATRLPAGGGE